jgi:hypothetical protein
MARVDTAEMSDIASTARFSRRLLALKHTDARRLTTTPMITRTRP